MNENMNVLFIITDQQRADMMGCSGNKIIETPNLDRLAKDSVRFSNAFCTSPMCMPNRATMITGYYPNVHGVRSNGINLPQNKRIEIGLTYVFGIGKSSSNKILKQADVDPNTRIKDLRDEQIEKLRGIIEKNYKVEGDKKRVIVDNIKRLKEIKCFRGSRHSKNLPARGQRTKTNSRTVRGNVRKTMGSGRRNAAEKT